MAGRRRRGLAPALALVLALAQGVTTTAGGDVAIDDVRLERIFSLAFSPDGELLAVKGEAGTVLVDVDTRKVRIAGPDGARLPPTDITFSSDGRQLLAPIPSGVWHLDVDAGRWTRLDVLDPGQTRRMVFSASGTLLAVAMPGTRIAVWDWGHATLVRDFHVTDLEDMAFARGDSLLILAHGWGDVRFFDVRSGELLLVGGHGGPGSGVAVHPSRPLAVSTATGGWWGKVRIWSLDPPDSVAAFGTTGYYVGPPRFSDDGERFAYDGHHSAFTGVTVWSTEPLQEVAEIDGRLVGFARQSHDLYLERDGWIRRHDPDAGTVVDSLPAPSRQGRNQAYSRAASLLAYGDTAEVVHLVELGGAWEHPQPPADPPGTLPGPADSTTAVRSAIRRVYPNPARDAVAIEFGLETRGAFAVTVYDGLGRPVRTVARAVGAPGVHTAHWDGRGDDGRAVANGRYVVRLRADGRESHRNLVWLPR